MMDMLILGLLVAGLLLELVIIKGVKRTSRQPIFAAAFTLLILAFSTSSIVAKHLSLASLLLLPLLFVHIVILARLAESKVHPKELYSRSLRSYLISTFGVGLVLSYVFLLDDKFAVSYFTIVIVQCIGAAAFCGSVLVSRYMYRYRREKIKSESLELPTVSVCIPARNETQDLPECIESVLASTYPKLEIIVLDDCSHDKTPDIIKKYAHAGVRFVNGKEPRSDWLPKNAAYDRLADEALGDILIFIGVDVRLKPQSVTELVMQLGDDQMLSVLPARPARSESAIFIQPIRYWWELGLGRFATKRPPVLSTCWAIRAEAMRSFGGFDSLKKAIEPEAVLAHAMHQQKAYAFLVSNQQVGVFSVKAPADQYKTALRMRYAQLRRKPEMVAAVTFIEAMFFIAPFVVLMLLVNQSASITSLVISTITIVLLVVANATVHRLSMRMLWPVGLLNVPLLVVVDWFLLARSLYAYEFGKVIWKERNICLPLFEVEKSLPKV